MRTAFADFFLVLKKLGLVLIIYTICRIAFYYFNASYFGNEGLLRAFIGGIRFDISAIIYVNLLFILLSLAPFPFRQNNIYRKIVSGLFLSFNAVGILFNCIDIEYFKFTLKRSTFDLFTQIGTGDDMKNLVPQFIKDYWYLILLFLLLTSLLHFISKKIKSQSLNKSWDFKNYLIQVSIFLVTLALIVLGGRGGFQYRPLSLINATQYGNADKMPLILNTPFTLIRSYEADYLNELNYFASEQECSTIFDPAIRHNTNERSHDNVVILLLESFSYEFLNSIGEHGQYLTPFLDSLASSSLYFERSYANGKKSVEGVPSVCSSLPSLMTNPFIFSPYSANKVNSLAQVLKEEGYYNSFFHGGVNGTMGFDSYALASGFNNYFGINEYPYEGHEDGTWGVYDEEFFDFFNQKILEQKEPFFSLCFSLTSHHPYKIPERYEDVFPRAKNPYEHVIQYTDYALKTFFTNASNQDWFDRTLFILTADHTAQSSHPYFRNREGVYRVPLMFYHPEKITPKRSNKIAQQIDIFPTVIDFLGIDKSFISFGNSLLSSDESYAVQYLNNIYQIINNDYHLEFDGENSIALYDLSTDSLLKKNILVATDKSIYEPMERKLKAIIQTYNDRMINNRLFEE